MMQKKFRPRQLFFSGQVILATVLLLILFTGCGGTSSSKKLTPGPGALFDSLDAGKVQGKVYAKETSIPVKGAIIETFEQQAVTDEKGQYLLGPMPAGDYRLIARAPGYAATVKEGVRVYTGRITENIDYQLDAQTASHSPDFAVIALVPFTGTDGDIITVYCSGCGSERGQVTFNGKDATIIDWNSQRDDRIVVQVPGEVETGPVRVIINGQTSTETQPQLFIGRPVILKADPEIAQAGQIIHISGRNFNPIDRFNRVTLKGDACSVTSVIGPDKLQIQLPVTARTGNLAIRIESNEYQLDGISNVVVTIKPEILHISPKRSVAGVPLTIYGKNFGDNRNNVKVSFGGYIINSADFLSFSDTKISVTVPDNTILGQGQTAKVSVLVNEAQSNGLNYTAYNMAFNTITDYGIYDFPAVSSNGTMRLATLRPTDRIAFLSVMSGNSNEDLDGDFYYSFSGFLGGNFELVPPIQGNQRLSQRQTPADEAGHLAVSPLRFSSMRASMAEPASNTMSFYVRDFNSANPWDHTNDILATATLKASGSMSLVYLDQNATGITDNDALAISQRFDNIYDTIATACWDGLITSNPPEGNVDAQRRIVIFLTPILEEANLGERLVAYFDPRDKDLGAPNTAGTEILYANPRGYSENKDDFYGGLAETLQFMMYHNQKGNEGVKWQQMGLSTFARQEIGLGFRQQNTRAVNWVSQFLKNPENVSMNHWPDSATYADYGMAYLFTQYMFDRCGGYNAIALMERKTGFSGLEHINNYVITNAVPASTGLRDFFHDYAKALYCDNLGLPGTFTGYNQNSHQFSSIKLRGGTPSIEGLQGTNFGENPVTNRTMTIKGYTCSLVEYAQGNWGDLEIRIDATPSAGNFRTWVIFYSAEQLTP